MFQVQDLMASEVFALRKTDNLVVARSLMEMARIRHIPIIDEDENFIGIITHRDILAATVSKFADIDSETQEEIYTNVPINEIMRTDVKTVTPDTDIKAAAEILLEHKYGCLPVLFDHKLVGIITEADFLKLTVSLIDALDVQE